MFAFHYRYFLFAAFLFGVELFIGFFIEDEVIRPYLGDFLVVILIYCLLKSFLNLPVLVVASVTLLFSYAVEVLQFFNIVQKLGLQKSKFARIIIGTHFSWLDILSYTMGIILVLILERMFNRKQKST